MNWEEYQNSDWYREAHPERFERPTKRDKEEELMRGYLWSLDAYREEKRKKQEEEDNDEETTPTVKCTYIVTKLWNCRVRGILYHGDYESCLYRQYQYNLACIDSEWESAGIKRIEYNDDDELDEILNGYRECEYEFEYDDYDYEY